MHLMISGPTSLYSTRSKNFVLAGVGGPVDVAATVQCGAAGQPRDVCQLLYIRCAELQCHVAAKGGKGSAGGILYVLLSSTLE